MQYKTIILELLQRQPKLHEQLRMNRILLPVLETCAEALKMRHEALKKELTESNSGITPSEIPSAAMEIAVQEMESRLQTAFPPDGQEPLSLEGAMAFIRNPTLCD